MPLMTFMARLAPELRDHDTVCLNIYCSLNSRARWEISGKLQAKLLNLSEQSITDDYVTLKPISRSNRQWTMKKKRVSCSLEYCSGIRPFVKICISTKKLIMVWTIMPIVREENLDKDNLLINWFLWYVLKKVLNYVFTTRYLFKWT